MFWLVLLLMINLSPAPDLSGSVLVPELAPKQPLNC